jgi:phosphate starvation-inducible PhoH-like protein
MKSYSITDPAAWERVRQEIFGEDAPTPPAGPVVPGEDEPDWRAQRDADVTSRGRLKPLTKGHEFYMKMVETSTVTLCVGPAGTGKTYMACGLAAQMLKDRRVSRIVLTRPIVSCGRGYGFRPGDVREKIAPVMRPMLESLDDFFSPKELQRHIDGGAIDLFPLDDMRGASIRDAVIICDEAQNAEYPQLHMLLTRFGKGSRLVVNGDLRQTDLERGAGSFASVIRKLKAEPANPDIAFVTLTRADIVRHPLIQFIDERLSDEVS